MFGTLGTQEMVFIFLLALILFGPKKLPEIGRTIGKALTEFRRASSELKSTFDREVKALEAETKSLDVTNQYQQDTYNYDYSSYDATYEGAYGETYDSTADTTPTISASASQDAESPAAVAIEGTVPQGSEIVETPGHDGEPSAHAGPAASEEPSIPAEHNA
jgi:sec-independent protein translocase protein TatA